MSLGEKSGKVSIPEMLINCDHVNKLAQWPEVHNIVVKAQVLRGETPVCLGAWLGSSYVPHAGSELHAVLQRSVITSNLSTH